MVRPLSDDLRIRLVEAVEPGGTIRAVGERFGVNPSSVSKIHQRWRRTGSVTAAPMGGDCRSGSTEAHGPRILALLEGQPDLTLDEICAALRPAGVALRQRWRQEQHQLTPERLVFLDETWASTAMARPRGRAPRGKRLVSAVPHGHWKTTTFVAGLRQSGVVAPLVLDGPMNGEVFRACVEQMLAPTLQPGDVVITDNLSAHKVDGIRQAIEAQGAKLVYLPPYSPDLNPIEQLFAKLKALLRKAAARTVSTLWAAIGVLLQSFEPDECANYFRHAGYGSN